MVPADKRTTVSPEIIARLHTKQKFVEKVWRYFFVKPFIAPLNNFSLRYKYRRHADPRNFDWDWRSINFNRTAVVNLLLSQFNDPSYLEIGCASNSLFDAVPCLNKVGVDPASGGNVKLTSDQFFASNHRQFNVIFIDGLHTYEQVRRDVINAINTASNGGWIVLHDMLPRDWVEHHVPVLTSGSWTGDVWKVAFELSKTDGIEFKILKIDNGVGVIKVLNRAAELKDFREDLTFREFNYYYDNINKLPIVDWIDAQDWLRS